jgi:hypothetical protein
MRGCIGYDGADDRSVLTQGNIGCSHPRTKTWLKCITTLDPEDQIYTSHLITIMSIELPRTACLSIMPTGFAEKQSQKILSTLVSQVFVVNVNLLS